MPKIRYIEHDGRSKVVDVPVGSTLMEGARQNSIEGIEAECGGACACATCHIYLDDTFQEIVPLMDQAEQDMLDFAIDRDPQRSRLSCQIKVVDEMDGMDIHLPETQM